jgi:hypothetical protein
MSLLTLSKDLREGVLSRDPQQFWESLETALIDEGYPTAAIDELRSTLTAQRKIGSSTFSERQRDRVVDKLLERLEITSV